MTGFFAFLLSLVILVPMGWLVWESTVLVSKKREKRK